MITLKGLTWDHPRAYEGLLTEAARFNALNLGISLTWDRHSLRRFEEAPLAELAAGYDLVIFDHPFVGDAALSGCLLDLSSAGETLKLADIAADGLGPSYQSYTYAGGQWALPLDAACQTAALRPDLLVARGKQIPVTISEALEFGQRSGLGLALAVPHAFMNHLSLCGLMGADISGEGHDFLDLHLSAEAISLQRRLVRYAPAAAADWSSIKLLDAMAGSEDLAYAPLVFCFNTYSRPRRGDYKHQLAFAAPPVVGGQQGGPVVGGAGIGVSAASPNREAALTAVAHLMTADAHRRMAIDGGQPGRASIWQDAEVNAANGNFFADTRSAMARSLVRPRYPDYISFQNAAGALLRRAMLDEAEPALGVAEALEALFAASARQSDKKCGSLAKEGQGPSEQAIRKAIDED